MERPLGYVLVAPIFLAGLAFKFLYKKKTNVLRNAEDADTGAFSLSTAPTDTNSGASILSTVLTDTNSGASISSTVPTKNYYAYDVFLNFSSLDTQNSFTDHLYVKLVDAGIRTFREEEELHVGEMISPTILAAIEQSKIMIPILSLNYGSSKRCLDELVQIMECKNNNTGYIVLPIFYKVKPSEVRHQSGRFGDAFRKSERRIDPKFLEKWKQALVKVSSLRGWEANGNEGVLVKSVVRKVLLKLKNEFELGIPEDIVGIDRHVEKVIKLVDNNATLFVGIQGMGGIGKTFLAQTIYYKVSDQFEGCSFIHDIRESCERYGLERLQRQLIFDILKLNIEIHNKDEGTRFLSSRFTSKKVLILLDDVDDNDQLKALAANRNWFSPGSRILITTRNKTILDNPLVDYKFELEEMENESLILSSSSTVLTRNHFLYEVFLSFRGKDTREGFTDHLYTGLVDAGIRAFRDNDNLREGEEIGLDLFAAIENSKILIPILSQNYGSSKWCLDELVYMLECKNNIPGHIVFPIFYKVKPAEVQHQIGSFGDAFHAHTKRFDPMIVEKWKQALVQVTYLKGWEANWHEGNMVKSIVQQIFNELGNAMELVVSDYLVGINSHVEKVMELVNKNSDATLFVGIYGMGGSGKTTLAKVIYNKLLDQFDCRSFIADIRESCMREARGIAYLQDQFIFHVLGRKHLLRSFKEGIDFLSSRFQHKKVLLLLDDVNKTHQLEALAGNPNWFAPGSRIFVTTRNKTILDSTRVDIKYELKEMDGEQSLILFSRHAFRTDSPPSEFLALSRTVQSTTGGLPLAIEVAGSSLCGKNPSQWGDTIQEIQENVLPEKVRKSLRISYDELECIHKQIFLDIACFLIGSDVRVALYMWDACGFCSEIGIDVLRSLSLINIGDNRELGMQNQMRDLGRSIVREENYSRPPKRSRLWDYEEALEVILGNEGTKKIEAICLEKGNSTRTADEDDSGYINDQGSRTFTDEQFRGLRNLRFLHMSDVNLTGDFNEIFSKLRWLKWGNCPPNFEASNFHVRKLVILDLSGSTIPDDWQGWRSMMMAEELKVLNLTGCRSLKRTSYLSAFKRVEILILRDCSELEQIDPCIGDMKNLVSLDLSGCSRLKELPPQMAKLEQLEELLLDETAIQEIPSSISSLKNLETLSANNRILTR